MRTATGKVNQAWTLTGTILHDARLLSAQQPGSGDLGLFTSFLDRSYRACPSQMHNKTKTSSELLNRPETWPRNIILLNRQLATIQQYSVQTWAQTNIATASRYLKWMHAHASRTSSAAGTTNQAAQKIGTTTRYHWPAALLSNTPEERSLIQTQVFANTWHLI